MSFRDHFANTVTTASPRFLKIVGATICTMEAYVRSSGTLSCSGSHLSQDFRTFYMHPGCRNGRSWPQTFVCKASDDSCRPVSALVQHEGKLCRARRVVLCAAKANTIRSREPEGVCLHASQLVNYTSCARAAGFAAVSIAALLHPSDAHAAELVPLDLFSSFLVSFRVFRVFTVLVVCVVS